MHPQFFQIRKPVHCMVYILYQPLWHQMLLIQEVGDSGAAIGIIILDTFRWYEGEDITIGDSQLIAIARFILKKTDLMKINYN